MMPLVLALVLAAPVPAGEGWWDKDWKFRRPVAVRNRLDRPLEKGFTMQVSVDPDYLGLRDRSRADFADWALVLRGARVPCLVQPGRGKTLLLNFRIAEDIPAGGLAAYLLYYGNPDAAPAKVGADEVFEFFEDFSRPESLAERFAVDKDLSCSVQDGALVIRDSANGRQASSPCRIAFRKFPALADFDLSFDLEMESQEAAAAGCALTIDLKEPGASDDSTARKVAALVEQLGDDAWETRERATRELIALGRPAVARLTEVVRSMDAEIQWRAAHILKEIADRHPPPLISAGVSAGDGRMPVALTSTIGKIRTTAKSRTGWPVKIRVSLQRDADGEVRVSWDGRSPQSGQLSGDIREVGFSIFKNTASPLGTIRIDNIVVRRYVDEDSQPTSLIDLEETRP
jgi:hypothetical protein